MEGLYGKEREDNYYHKDERNRDGKKVEKVLNKKKGLWKKEKNLIGGEGIRAFWTIKKRVGVTKEKPQRIEQEGFTGKVG